MFVRGRYRACKVVVIITCSLLTILVILFAPVLGQRAIELVMSVIRTVGPAFRGSCSPRGAMPPANTSIGVVSFNGVKDELYQVRASSDIRRELRDLTALCLWPTNAVCEVHSTTACV